MGDEQPSFIKLGHPSYVWRRGLDRRLALLRQYVDLEGRWILDVGCGVGTWAGQFRNFSDHVYGIDLDRAKLQPDGDPPPGLCQAVAEALPFRDNSFDVVFLHEVIEHVTSDRTTVQEAVRCTRAGGAIVIFAPNRLYPFETHGFFLGGRFVFRLLPFINYMPDVVRNKFCPHVRVYTRRGIRRLFQGLPAELVVSSHIYPGLDNIADRHRTLGPALHRLIEMAERTPLRSLGISHFVVARKV